MDELLLELIREFVEEVDSIDEFSGVASIAGVSLPLGAEVVHPGRKKKRKIKEASTVLGCSLGAMMDKDFDGIIDDRDPYIRSVEQRYIDQIVSLSKSFGGATSPVKNKKDAIKHYAQMRP